MNVTSDAFVLDTPNSRNVSVKATAEVSVTIAGLTLQSDVVLSIADDGTVTADRENVSAKGDEQVLVSRRLDTGAIAFVHAW